MHGCVQTLVQTCVDETAIGAPLGFHDINVSVEDVPGVLWRNGTSSGKCSRVQILLLYERKCAASEFLLAVANTLDEGTTSYSERAVAVAAAAATRFSSKKETTSRAEQQASL